MSQDAARGLTYVAKLTGGRFASQLVLVITAVVLPRILGADNYGTYAAWMALVAIGGGIAAFGLPMVETRYLAPLWSLGERQRAVELGSTIWTVKLVLSVVSGLGVAVWLLASPRLAGSVLAVALVGVLATAMYAHEATASLLLPFGRIGTLSLFLLLRAVLTLPAVVLAFFFWGLEGVAGGLGLVFLTLGLASWWVLARAAPVRVSAGRWHALRPFAGFATAVFVANLAWRFQGQFSIYALANWVTPAEAAYLALALQLYNFIQLLVLSARRALTPILGEMDERGETQRTHLWIELVMRWTAAAITAAALGWALIGGDIVNLLFTDTYAPVHETASWILLCALSYGCAEWLNMLPYVSGRAHYAAFTMTIYAGGTIAGLFFALGGPEAGTASRAATAYAVAALIYFVVTYLVVAHSCAVRLPLGRTVCLALPAVTVPWLTLWDAPPSLRFAAFVGILVVYSAMAFGLGLLPREGWSALRARMRDSGPTP